ncbi:hypothetical protein PV325_013816, partial [Microctonus aethiopoides]
DDGKTPDEEERTSDPLGEPSNNTEHRASVRRDSPAGSTSQIPIANPRTISTTPGQANPSSPSHTIFPSPSQVPGACAHVPLTPEPQPSSQTPRPTLPPGLFDDAPSLMTVSVMEIQLPKPPTPKPVPKPKTLPTIPEERPIKKVPKHGPQPTRVKDIYRFGNNACWRCGQPGHSHRACK